MNGFLTMDDGNRGREGIREEIPRALRTQGEIWLPILRLVVERRLIAHPVRRGTCPTRLAPGHVHSITWGSSDVALRKYDLIRMSSRIQLRFRNESPKPGMIGLDRRLARS